MDHVLTVLLFGIGGIAVLAAHVAYWVKIEPILRYLELIDCPRVLGFWDARLWEYKSYCVDNNTPLTWWWVYWGSLWSVIVVQVGIAFVWYSNGIASA